MKLEPTKDVKEFSLIDDMNGEKPFHVGYVRRDLRGKWLLYLYDGFSLDVGELRTVLYMMERLV